jgi:uncharacterized membrane protein YgcG
MLIYYPPPPPSLPPSRLACHTAHSAATPPSQSYMHQPRCVTFRLPPPAPLWTPITQARVLAAWANQIAWQKRMRLVLGRALERRRARLQLAAYRGWVEVFWTEKEDARLGGSREEAAVSSGRCGRGGGGGGGGGGQQGGQQGGRQQGTQSSEV